MYFLESYKKGEVSIRLKSPVQEKNNCKLVSPIYNKGDYVQQIHEPGFYAPLLLGQFRYNLVLSNDQCLYQYNLITGDLVKIHEVNGLDGHAIVCSDDENLYVFDIFYDLISLLNKNLNRKLKLSVLSGSKCKVTKTKVFNSVSVYNTSCLLCYSGKIYIFYFKKVSKHEQDARLLILSTNSFTVLKDSKIKDKLNIDEKLKKSCFSDTIVFKTIFHDKKNSKFFIYCGQKTPILVFDIRKENFHFIENTISDSVKPYFLGFCMDLNNNIVYEAVLTFNFPTGSSLSDPLHLRYAHTRIKAFEYMDEKFVDTGFKCESDDLCCLSICYI